MYTKRLGKINQKKKKSKQNTTNYIKTINNSPLPFFFGCFLFLGEIDGSAMLFSHFFFFF